MKETLFKELETYLKEYTFDKFEIKKDKHNNISIEYSYFNSNFINYILPFCNVNNLGFHFTTLSDSSNVRLFIFKLSEI